MKTSSSSRIWVTTLVVPDLSIVVPGLKDSFHSLFLGTLVSIGLNSFYRKRQAVWADVVLFEVIHDNLLATVTSALILREVPLLMEL